MMTIAELNLLDQSAFTQALSSIYENSPWVAERAWPHRPFASRDALHAAMKQVLAAAGRDEQLALINEHPELASKAAVAGHLTEESKREQSGAGLDQCSPQEYEQIRSLNNAYRDKFGFPFIVAVRGLDRDGIIGAIRRRLDKDYGSEFDEALAQINRIAGFRLADKLA